MHGICIQMGLNFMESQRNAEQSNLLTEKRWLLSWILALIARLFSCLFISRRSEMLLHPTTYRENTHFNDHICNEVN